MEIYQILKENPRITRENLCKKLALCWPHEDRLVRKMLVKLSKTNPVIGISSRKGYILAEDCTQEDITECLFEMNNRIKAIEERKKNLMDFIYANRK